MPCSSSPKTRVEMRIVGDVAFDAWFCADALHQRPHALFQRFALIGESQFRALRGELLGDAPGDRLVVGHAHDQPALAGHQIALAARSSRRPFDLPFTLSVQMRKPRRGVKRGWELTVWSDTPRGYQWLPIRNSSRGPKRIEGQVRGLTRMVEDGRYCIDVAHQIEAVRAALARTETEMLKAHLTHCIEGAITRGDVGEQRKKAAELIDLLERTSR